MKFLIRTTLLAVFVFFVGASSMAQAEQVQIYDYGVENILNNLKRVGDKNGFKIWGTQYLRDKNVGKICATYFGDSKWNSILFKINDTGAVSSAFVIFPSDESNTFLGGRVTGVILISIGMNNNEAQNLTNNMISDLIDFARRNPYADSYKKTFSYWISNTKRYVDVTFEVKGSDCSFDISAHI
ncbi:MAG: hypothetical protein IJL12_06275 [Selenomonadaceae bacterium]|nr:hypothetical protein [Selenomonadaceae bacterium]